MRNLIFSIIYRHRIRMLREKALQGSVLITSYGRRAQIITLGCSGFYCRWLDQTSLIDALSATGGYVSWGWAGKQFVDIINPSDELEAELTKTQPKAGGK